MRWPHIVHSWALYDVIGTCRFFQCRGCPKTKARIW